MYAAGTKKSNKHTLNTRGCVFGVLLNTRGGLTRTPYGALKGTKARTRTKKTLYTIPVLFKNRNLFLVLFYITVVPGVAVPTDLAAVEVQVAARPAVSRRWL